MSASALALIGYVAWTLLLVITIISVRTWISLMGKRESYSFKPDGSDVSEASVRLCRVHANCVENLPIFGAIILVAIATGHSDITDSLALWVLAARVAQSVTHLISTSNLAVTVRVTFFTVQLAIEAWWVIQLAKVALSA
ncbi:MAG: MAPEG family protein [Myxococcales bacterium]|nr:MAPEG family protein [Myxococcales bacterium]MDH3483490.1 MAPEG family protein [Myxococcales bacterium]